jgi:N-succinyldiaminopimelate aminotransferase
MSESPHVAEALKAFGTTIFAEMSALAVATGAINLGQGFPNYDGPPEVLDRAVDEIRSGNNQYPPGSGTSDLREAISRHQLRFWNLTYDPDTEVLVTAGATEALAGALLGLLNDGDEVVVFEPMYDSYMACIAMARARAVPVLLRPQNDGRYVFDVSQLQGALSPRTRAILLNTPHNPTGTVFSREELEIIASLAREHDLVVISDEVYEHLVFDDARHVPIATLEGMRERTITISSGGKTFNTTGWKIGWACAPSPLLTAVRTAKQFLTYVNGAPFQPAIAVGLSLPDSYFVDISEDLRQKRDVLLTGLTKAGLTTHKPEGTYFITADIRAVEPDGDGLAFCRRLPHSHGVVAIPNGVFYSPDNAPEGRHLVRFAFCKTVDLLERAVERLCAGVT